jgi:hypothetical protein
MSNDQDSDFAAKLELAWAAGFFDGEGSTSLQRDKRSVLSWTRVSVTQVNVEHLRRFMRAVGGIGKVYDPYEKRGGRSQCIWSVNGCRAKEVLMMLWPYLTGEKKTQAEAVIAAERNTGKADWARRTHCPQGHPYSGDNLIIQKPYGHKTGGGRLCRECQKRHCREARKRRKIGKEVPECPPMA